MSLGAVHQFHSGAAVGDAITNQMFDLQRRLRRLGFYSEVYSQHIDDRLSDRVKPLSAFVEMPSTVLLVHHSMGHSAFDDLVKLQIPMVTVFHSITPASFFTDLFLREHVRLGFRQLDRLASRSLFGVADSNHNRQQMYDAGFRTVEVMPVRTDFREHRAVRDERGVTSPDWLFVGRVMPNKRQLDLVRAHAIHRRSGGAGRLHLVGDLSLGSYVDEVRQEIARLGSSCDVVVHGHVDQRQLLDSYRDAGLFVCLSEHEGFGVPLLEAMAAGIPVIARNEAAVAETLGGAGMLLVDRDPSTAAAAARVVADDDDLRHRVVYYQDQRLAKVEAFDVDAFLGRLVRRAAGSLVGTTVQIQGPFETSYSLAILNRELALALAEQPDFEVSIHATEGPGDYEPNSSDLATYPAATTLYENGFAVAHPEIAIRQMYPPRVADTTAGMTFQYFGWEESRLPTNIVDDFNRHLDGIGTMSTYVKELLTQSGVEVPMAVVGVGVNAPDPAARCRARELKGIRTVRFLHISSAFPRKGIDVLLRAYFETFDADDDVSLVLKTFPNPFNTVATMLTNLRAEFPNGPHVCWIDRDLKRSELDGLYNLASAYVHTARGEGFGLPVAEAMLAEVPVISVASTGLADFVSSATAAVVGHTSAMAVTHLSLPGSEWTEPSLEDLCRELVSLVRREDEELRRERVEAARTLIAAEFSWARVAERWHGFIVDRRRHRAGVSVAAVSTFNSRCGIAEYTGHLYDELGAGAQLEIFADDNSAALEADREVGVQRAWSNHRTKPVDGLMAALDTSGADLVHIQYNFGFFELGQLGRLIAHESARRPVIVTLHRTAPLVLDDHVETMGDIAEQLQLAAKVIVHQESDRQRLLDVGVVDNVEVLSIGTVAVVERAVETSRRRYGIPQHAFVVGTFGFLLPHKGVITLLRSIAELRARGIDTWLVATCALHLDSSSAAHLVDVNAEIELLGLERVVRLTTDFLPVDDVFDRLSAADVIVMPYEDTKESASAALRSVLPIGRAMITSDLPIFDDVAGVVPRLPAPVEPIGLADVLEELWLDDLRRSEIADAVRGLADQTSWQRIASETARIYSEVLNPEFYEQHAAAG